MGGVGWVYVYPYFTNTDRSVLVPSIGIRIGINPQPYIGISKTHQPFIGIRKILEEISVSSIGYHTDVLCISLFLNIGKIQIYNNMIYDTDISVSV